MHLNRIGDLEPSSPIRIGIAPHKSSYFAGEQIEVHISIRNTRSALLPQVSSSPTPPHISGHRRASHSISSAQIYKPPTSPGPAILPSTHESLRDHNIPPTTRRRGLIGSKVKSRSHSVDISNTKSPFSAVSLFRTTPDPESPLPEFTRGGPATKKKELLRSTSIHVSHPHARKASVDHGAHPLSTPFQHPQSNFTASLDSISEIGVVENSYKEIATFNDTHTQGGHRAQTRPSSLPPLEIQQRRPTPQYKVVPSVYLPPGSEQLVYGYVHLQGTLAFDKTTNLLQLQKELRTSRAFGGGSLEILGFTSSATQVGRSNPQHSHGSWSSLGAKDSQEAEEGKISIFEFQSEPLFVDLVLTPGESRSFTVENRLPFPLPPTFRGKFIRVDYQLTIGISRSRSSLDPPSTANHLSQVMNMPLRVYDRVHVHKRSIPYDVRSIINRQNLKAKVTTDTKLISTSSFDCISSSETTNSGHSQICDYASRIIAVDSQSSVDLHASLQFDGHVDDSPTGSRDAVEVLTRTAKTASYSIDKGDTHVATLLLAKTAFRLGESVSGVIEMNQTSRDWACVLKLMIKLETVEALPASLAVDPRVNHNTSRQHLRTISDFHCSSCNRIKRIPFALDIPSDGTPNFEIYDSLRSDIPKGLEWRLRFQILIAVPTSHTSHFGRRNLVRDKLPSEWDHTYTASESIVPLERWPSSHQVLSSNKNGWFSYLMPPALVFGGPNAEIRQGFSELGDSNCDAGLNTALHNRPIEWDGGDINFSRHWKGKGKEGSVEPDGIGEEHEWRQMRLEVVECKVPLKVWPGNTAFRPNEVSFHL